MTRAAATMTRRGMPGGMSVPASPGVTVGGYWERSVYLTLAMMATVAVRIHEFWPGIFAPFRPVLTVSVIGFAFMLSRTSPMVRRLALENRQSRLILAYFGFIVLTVPFALWPGLAFATAKGLLPAILLFGAFTLVPPRRDVLDTLQLGFVVLVLFFASYGQLFGRSRSGRLLGIGGMYDSNDMASLMALAFPLAAGLLIRSKKGRPRAAAALAVVSLVLGVIATGSRGGTLALLMGSVIFALGLRGSKSALVIVAMIVGGGLAWSTASPDFRARMSSITNLENDYNLTDPTGRKAVWARGRQYWKSNPIIGVGGGNFPIAEGGSWADQGLRGKWSNAHNAYVQAFAELGTIGGAIFISMLLVAAWQVLPAWRATTIRGRAPPWHRPELLASIAAYAAGAYFLSHAYFPPLFALLGLMTLADRAGRAALATRPGVEEERAVIVRTPGQRGGFSYVRSIMSTRGHGFDL